MSKLAPGELEAYLGKAVNIIWGVISPEHYKEYIFPLLFFKRVSDIYDEETKVALDFSDGDAEYASQPENHNFIIPDGAHWSDVRSQTENIGMAINDALHAIENANSNKLLGVFGNEARWTDKELISDRTLKSLIEQFSTKVLNLETCGEDEFGQGYEYMIKRFADDSGHTAQEFYTNRTVVHLMTEMLKPRSGESIYDPTCGTGGMLISSIAYLKRNNLEWRNVKLFGQETIPFTASISRMNMFLHGVKEFEIAQGDTLLNPLFLESGFLKKFDLVLANPPYSIKEWNREAFTYDKFGRNLFGTPPQGRADYAFIQHIIASMKPDSGRCAILLPHGILFREEEKEIRTNLIKSDLIECVIGLAPNLFYNASMEACVLICRTKKPAERKNSVLLINAINEVSRKNSQSFLEDKHISKIADAYENYTDEEFFSKVISYDDIEKENFNLNIALYISTPDVPEDPRSIRKHYFDWLKSTSNARNEIVKVLEMVGNGGDLA